MTRRTRPIRICYAGTYERAYPRNRLVVRALREAGARVEEAHAPVFERVRDKSGAGPLSLVLLALRLVLAYTRLLPEVALRLLRCDVLAVGYIGQGDMLVLGPLARLMGRPVLFNPLVTLTDTLVEDRALLKAGSAGGRIVAAVDCAALRLADVVLVDTDENGRYLAERFGVTAEQRVCVPVGADEGLFFPEAGGQGAGDDATLDVLFVGKFIPLHGIETILLAVAILKSRGAPVRVELVGTGQTYAEMRALARELGILDAPDTLVWTEWVPYQQLGARLRRADVALGIFGDGEKAARVVPNKVYQSLACGVATVTRHSPAATALLADGENALLVPAAEPDALVEALTRLTDPELRARIAADGRRAYEAHASSSALAAAVRPALDLLAARRWP